MSTKRENNYDLLRIIATFAVIMLHVSAEYVNALTSETMYGKYDVTHIGVICFYNVISRFAVPCFIMLSGAFILADERNGSYKYFYAKIFRSIGIPTIVFSILYFLYSVLQRVIAIIYRGDALDTLLDPLTDWIKGEPYYHMWYLYMMAGVYLLVPIIIKVKKDLGEKSFEVAAWLFLALATASLWTSTYKLKWNIGFSFCFLGYFMIGYVLRQKSISAKSTSKACVCILAGLLLEVALSVVKQEQVSRGIADSELEYSLIEPYNPFIVIASLLIFWGFSQIKVKRDMRELSAITFLIYLFHAGIWSIGAQIILHAFGEKGDARIMIPAAVLVVFCVSAILAVLYRRIWNKFDRRFHFMEGLCNKIGLYQ